MSNRGTAFTPWQWGMITQTITQLRTSALTHFRHGVKSRALFDAFVHDDDKEPLQRVFKICDVNTAHQAFKYKQLIRGVEVENLTADISAVFAITIQEHAKFKFLFPKYMEKAQLQKEWPELEEAFRLVATINFEWARVRDVLAHLHVSCATANQVKTLCPSLPAMLGTSSDTGAVEWADRLRSQNDTMKLPALDLQLRKHALYIGQTITKGLLVPKESEIEEDEFTITMTEGATKKPRWDGALWSAI